jgi:hypothetical protein
MLRVLTVHASTRAYTWVIHVAFVALNSRWSPKPDVRQAVILRWAEDCTLNLPGPRRVLRARQKFTRIRTCLRAYAKSSGGRASMSANV